MLGAGLSYTSRNRKSLGAKERPGFASSAVSVLTQTNEGLVVTRRRSGASSHLGSAYCLAHGKAQIAFTCHLTFAMIVPFQVGFYLSDFDFWCFGKGKGKGKRRKGAEENGLGTSFKPSDLRRCCREMTLKPHTAL